MTVLFVVAKRRQWDIRQSIKRASRRLTGRGNPKPSASDRQSKRGGVQMKGIPSREGQKRGAFVEVKDAEKGIRSGDKGWK
jgi:hypothetical protein